MNIGNKMSRAKNRWLFIIDPIELLVPSTDTTYAIMIATYLRGIQTNYCTIQDLYISGDNVWTSSKIISFIENAYIIDKIDDMLLDSFDLIFMRKEPPYDLNFHYATQMLSLSSSIVVNSPQALRNYNEKLIIMNFPKLIPDTIITSDETRILDFLERNPEGVILKKLDSYQGRSVWRIQKGDPDITHVIGKFTKDQSEAAMVQRYIQDIDKGDKRILILGGKAIGAVNRVPLEDSYLANFGQGGSAQRTNITEKEQKIVNTISSLLIKNGIHMAGIDVIDGFLTEINITCPTGLQQINMLENIKLEEQVVDYFISLM